MPIGAIITGLAALAAAIGGGISASSSASAAKRQAEEDRLAAEELARKQRRQEQFRFGFASLAQGRRDAEGRARRSSFNKQVFRAIGENRSKPTMPTQGTSQTFRSPQVARPRVAAPPQGPNITTFGGR